MNADRLFALYDHVADAPDAIARLRRFVLDLAVRGKLVEQDPGDEPAAELLKRIAAEKARLVKAGEIRKQKILPLVEEPPFNVPEDWRWTRMRQVTSDRGQRVPDAAFTYIDVTAIDKENGLVIGPKVLGPSEAPSRARKVARLGDVIYSCVRPYLLNVAVIEEDFDPAPIASTAFAVLNGHGLVLPRYLWIVLRSPFMVACVEQNQRGQAYPAINDADFTVLPIPLPPLPEQHRIVAKVDELMALCDQLEASRREREDTRDRLTKASLARLSAPDTDAVTFRTHARFAVDALPALTARTDQVGHLRQTILNLAMRGKLVEQDPTEEAVEMSFRGIRSKRDALVKSGKLRRTMPPSPTLEDEAPFGIPYTWIWVRVGEIALFTQYGTSSKAVHSDKGVPVLAMGNIQNGAITRTNEKKLPENSKEFPRLLLKKFDLLYNRTNSSELVGKTGIYLGDDDCLTFASYLIRIRLSLEHIAPRFVNFAMNAPDFRETQIVPHIKKQTGQANVSGSTLSDMLIPLPPLAEQHRIVAKVDELMALCDRLEANLTNADTARCHLFESLLHEALAPSADNDISDASPVSASSVNAEGVVKGPPSLSARSGP